MDLEKTLTQIESLLERSQKGEFVEPDLQHNIIGLIETLTDVPIEHQEGMRDLFIQIAAMNKSTHFGGKFYNKLQYSDLPFAQEVFEKAVYSEPYYNVEGDAIKGYFITVLRNNGLSNDKLFDYILQGSVRGELPEPIPLREDIKPEDYEHVKNAISHALNGNKGPFMIYAALKGTLVFGCVEIIDVLEERLESNITQMERFADPNMDRMQYLSTQASSTSEIAFTLFKLTGEEKYKRINELIDGEENIMTDAGLGKVEDYHLRYAGVHSQIMNVLE